MNNKQIFTKESRNITVNVALPNEGPDRDLVRENLSPFESLLLLFRRSSMSMDELSGMGPLVLSTWQKLLQQTRTWP